MKMEYSCYTDDGGSNISAKFTLAAKTLLAAKREAWTKFKDCPLNTRIVISKVIHERDEDGVFIRHSPIADRFINKKSKWRSFP